MANEDQAGVPRQEANTPPPETPAEAETSATGGEAGKTERKRQRVRIRQGRGSSSEAKSSKRRKKAKGSSGITYSVGSDSGISTGYRFWLTGGLIALGVLVMAYLVLSRLGGPPPIVSD